MAPWNIAQYALILHIVAKLTSKIPRNLRIVAQNVHLYNNQIEAAKEQLSRSEDEYPHPTIELPAMEPKMTIDEYFGLHWEKFRIRDYKSYPKLENQPEMLSYERW